MKVRDFSYAQKKHDKKKAMPTINVLGHYIYVWAIPLLPLIVLVILAVKLNDAIECALYNRRQWTDDKAIKILDIVLPHILEWVEEDNAYYFCDTWSNNIFVNNAPRYYRKWVQKYKTRLACFLIDTYQKTGYTKTLETDGFDTWVKFVAEDK